MIYKNLNTNFEIKYNQEECFHLSETSVYNVSYNGNQFPLENKKNYDKLVMTYFIILRDIPNQGTK